MGFGKEDHRAGMPSSSPDKGTTHQRNLLLMMLNRIPWLRYCLSDFSLLQSYPSLPPPFQTLLSGRKSLSSAHTYGVMELGCTALRADYTSYLEFFVVADLAILAHLFIYSLIYISMDS